MKYTVRANSSSLFLLELVVAILIFSFAGALSLQFFSKAHLLNRKAKVLNYFSNECSMAAEITGVASSMEELKEQLSALYPHISAENDGYDIYYDEALSFCEKENAAYHYSIIFMEENKLLSCTVRVTDLSTGEVIYELTGKHNLGGLLP